MRAFQLVEWQQPPVLRDVPVPEPGPGEVLVKVGGAGACHSDLHVMEWPAGFLPYELPFTLGHENAGWIEALGPGVKGWEAGEPVAIYGPWGCGRCRPCRTGLETLCERAKELGAAGGGLGRDGGMAEYMLVPDPRLLVPLGELDPRDAAPLSDAALTPYHAIKLALHQLVPGSSAVVIGVGGLGHMAVQILQALSPARVIATDIDASKLELAAAVGAHHTVAGPDTAARIRELTAGNGATLVLDCVGGDATLALDAEIVARGGAVMVIGVAGGTLPYKFNTLPSDASLSHPYWGSRVELAEVLELARAGHIDAHVEHFPLERVEDAYERMRNGTLSGRAVITPHG
ncbi:NAD(P)-dependent alcohol dehydrogenase [Solirubrobacter soli]|uniref:NAD(P)-dependent alcohol dehydrogenase n=1 Tax=Solirubrobacter soli TaxID=363832 RepID=UPI00040B5E49|nr:NAD(P)-dependent alcohol dehydrogenase [Solirubrobacter soli]